MTGEPLPNVSRETSDKLAGFVDLVRKWTKKINMISQQSSKDIWDRHIWDSAQLFSLAPPAGKWVDLGSGGGFPAIVIAIMSQGTGQEHDMVMVESDQRKAVFLRTALRQLDLKGSVISKRIEDVEPLEADVISARALAELSMLLGFADRHLKRGGVALFPKGAQRQKEAQNAQQMWSYQSEEIKSSSNPDAAVLRIKDITRV